MTHPDEIAAELPAPRDDEPESLRTDIIDELTDHLQSAFHRELHTRTTDPEPESAARRRVLRRFGNPSAIARRLWYDAMQEKIMSQRISTGSAVVAAAACLGMFVFMWTSSAANREMLQQSQQMNSQLLEQMQGLAASLTAGRGEDNRPAEWNELQVRCIADSEDGPPMPGVRVRLESDSENTVGIPPASLTTDAEGLVDFGLVLYGLYTVDLVAPNGMRTRRQVSVRPGIDTLETFVCPAGDGLAELRIEPEFVGDDAPPELLRDRIWYLVTLVRDNSLSSIWSRPMRDPRVPDVLHCFRGPNGELVAVDDQIGNPVVSQDSSESLRHVMQYGWTLPEGPLPAETLRVEPGYYSFSFGAVCIADENDETGRTLFQVLTPDRNPGPYGENSWTVSWGETNTLTFPVTTTTFAMLSRIIESAPELEVATLEVRPDDSFGGGRPTYGGSYPFGSRVALSLTSSGRRRRTPDDVVPPTDPLLTGVEVISFWDGESLSSGSFDSSFSPTSKLHVLLTPEERELLQSIERPLYAWPVAGETARTSLDPAVRAQLLEQAFFANPDAIQGMDTNGDGRLDEGEMPARFREFLNSRGVDTSQGVPVEALQELVSAERDE